MTSSQQKINEWLSKGQQQPSYSPQPIISEQKLHYKSKSYEVLIEPSATDAEKVVREGLLRKDCIVLVGSCIVNYFGRASSILPRGERVVILKPDGTVLVHQKEKREPVNWNPPGCRASARAVDGMLQITSVRTRPREVLVISFDSLKMASRFSLHDEEELYLFGTESQIVEEVVKNPSLIEEGFRPITKELRTEYGMIDLYGVDKQGNVVVIEFKRGRAGLDAVSQLKRYVDELKKERGGRVGGLEGLEACWQLLVLRRVLLSYSRSWAWSTSRSRGGYHSLKGSSPSRA
jgi:RecB family endonuclease NucS